MIRSQSSQTLDTQQCNTHTATAGSCIFRPQNWLDPLNWHELFPQPGPVEVELGCGKGTFLLWAAQTRPDTNFLGADRLLKRLRKADKKITRLGLPNLRLIHIEAGYLVSRLIPDRSVAAYHIYFPDPWPKRRHHRRRLFTADFVAALHRSLQPAGTINIATDHAEYFARIRQLFDESGTFTETAVPPLPEEARTDFERHCLAEGKSIYRCRYVRGA
jgi:tRNA (guanine-N7-)-methyltransferase